MALTKNSYTKQIIGIVLVVILLLTVFVYGTRGMHGRKGMAALEVKKEEVKKAEPQVETCQADDEECSLQTEEVR